jgi:hypothetical protein
MVPPIRFGVAGKERVRERKGLAGGRSEAGSPSRRNSLAPFDGRTRHDGHGGTFAIRRSLLFAAARGSRGHGANAMSWRAGIVADGHAEGDSQESDVRGTCTGAPASAGEARGVADAPGFGREKPPGATPAGGPGRRPGPAQPEPGRRPGGQRPDRGGPNHRPALTGGAYGHSR